jgi:hypothetical protein
MKPSRTLAIYNHTGFLLDVDTKKLYVVCKHNEKIVLWITSQRFLRLYDNELSIDPKFLQHVFHYQEYTNTALLEFDLQDSYVVSTSDWNITAINPLKLLEEEAK